MGGRFEGTWRADTTKQNISKMQVIARINKFLWFLKNFVDFSYPFVVAVADKNGFNVSAVIVKIKTNNFYRQ